jgi:hypothetical protein
VNSLLVMVAAVLFPVAVLGLLLWLTRLEETLPQAVAAAQRKPEPAPILAVPVRPARPAVTAVRIPAQRQAFSRSETPVSLGGSTKR